MPTTLGTRAVLRQIEAGNSGFCNGCHSPVKFVAKAPFRDRKQVIANVYEGGKWNRVEHFHLSCYEEAGQPYGEAVQDQKLPNGKPIT